MSKNGYLDYYTLLHRNRHWPWPWLWPWGTTTKYLVRFEEMATDKSILPIVYAKKELRQNPEAYIEVI
jgi:hypothetical protein